VRAQLSIGSLHSPLSLSILLSRHFSNSKCMGVENLIAKCDRRNGESKCNKREYKEMEFSHSNECNAIITFV